MKENFKATTCVVYARYSDEMQSGGFSVDAQLRACRDYAEKHGLTISREYVDEARSAMKASTTREQFTELMLDVRAKGRAFDTVLVHKSDRLARNAFDAIQARATFKLHGARLVSVTEAAVGGHEPEDQLLDFVLMGLNQHYSLNLGREAKKGLAEKARQGFIVSRMPFGYRRVVVKTDPGVRGKKPREHAKPDVDVEQAQVVRLIYELYDQGNGYRDIASTLLEKGVTTAAGKPFYRNAVCQILEHEAYVGRFRWNKTQKGHYKGMTEHVVVEGFFPPIVEQELWDRVQARRQRNRANWSNPHAYTTQYLFSGLVVCGRCGSKVVGATHASGKHPTYQCCSYNRAKAKHTCRSPRWKKDDFEAPLIAAVQEKILTREVLLAAIAKLNDVVVEEQASAMDDVKAVDADIAKLKTSMKRWYTQIDDGGVLYVDVKEHIDELKAKIERKEALRAQMLAARGAPADVNVSPELADRVVDRMRARLIEGGFGAQRGLLHDLIERVTATEEQAEVEYRMDLGAALVAFGQKKKEPPALTEGPSRTPAKMAPTPGLEPGTL